MRLHVIKGFVSVEGKPSEYNKIERALHALLQRLFVFKPVLFDNSFSDEVSLGHQYDCTIWTVKEVKEKWSDLKGEI